MEVEYRGAVIEDSTLHTMYPSQVPRAATKQGFYAAHAAQTMCPSPVPAWCRPASLEYDIKARANMFATKSHVSMTRIYLYSAADRHYLHLVNRKIGFEHCRI